jgi:VWFA-related protein
MNKPAAVALGFLLATSVQAQVPEAARPVKGSVEAVAAEVEVLVLDSKGVPVEGLTKTDFKLFVNGKEMPLDWLEAPSTSASPAPAAPAPAAQAAAAPAAAALARRAHSTVFVISDLHTDLRARNAGLDALRSYADRLPEGEPAAVYLLDSGVRRLQPFTTDRAALKKALEKPARMLPKSYVFSEAGGNEWVGQSRQMLRNFGTVLDSLASRPEPKTVVVLSGPISPTGFVAPIGGAAGSAALSQTSISTGAGPGSPEPSADVLSTTVTGRESRVASADAFSTTGYSYSARGLWNFLGEAKDAESQALLARATIVALDPTGLDSPNAKAEINSLATTGRIVGSGATLRPADSSTEGDRTDTWEFRNDTFALIAAATGGARLGFSNKPADLILDESRLLSKRYRLGFTPPDGTSARRTVRVEVARPGVVVRAAAGQRSLTPETAARARFSGLLLSADAPKGDFAIALETKGPVKKRTDDALPFDVLVPVSGVYAEEQGENKRAKLELLVSAVDDEGRASEPMVIPFSVELSKEAAVNGAFFRKDSTFSIDHRWKGRLFVGVRDTATNRLGAVAMPIGG